MVQELTFPIFAEQKYSADWNKEKHSNKNDTDKVKKTIETNL